MANDLNRSIKIFIDGTPAAKGIAPVEAAIKKLEAQLAALNKGEADYNEKSKKLKQELAAKNRTLQNYKTKVQETDRVLKDLSGATYNELLAVQQQVRKQMRESVRGTRQYNAALEQNKRVAQELAKVQKEMRVEVGCQSSTFGKAINVFNKYAAIVTAGIAAITGAVLKLNELRKKRNEREEAKADVKALTGLDDASVAWLEQQAKKLSTSMDENGIRIRQSATQILDAYKLVGSAKPELLSDKEALAEVTKQTLVLASASGMQLKDAVDAVTLSMNQYGDSSDQAARYANALAAGSKYGAAAVESVTTSVTKSGVAASSANIPIEQLVGTIETLAEKGIKDEIAGTGLKKFFLTLQTGADETNPKIVGLETALDNLQKKQLSATEIKKMFGEEGYNVASVLINEAEKVKYYTEAVTGTTVAVEQAATKSNTAAAKLDQAKNKMNEMGIALMEKLNPALVSSANGLVHWGSKFITLVDFITRNSGVIVTLTALIVTYYTANKAAALYETKLKDAKLAHIAVEKLSAYWQKVTLAGTLALSAAKYALTGNIKLATAAIKQLNLAMKGNLFGAIATLILSVGIALYKFITRTNEAKEAVNSFMKQCEEERKELRKLIDATKSSTEGTRRRKELIEEINSKYGKYLPNLLNEYSSLKDIEQAYLAINRAMNQNIAQKVLQEKTEEIERSTLENRIKQMNDVRNKLKDDLPTSQLDDFIQKMTLAVDKNIEAGQTAEQTAISVTNSLKKHYFKNRYMPKDVEDDIQGYAKVVEETAKRVNKVKKEMNPFVGTATTKKQKSTNVLDEVVITPNNNQPTGTPPSEEERKKLEQEAEKRRKAILEQEKQQIADIAALRDQALYDAEQKDTAAMNAYRLMLERKQITAQQYAVWEAAFNSNLADTKLSIEKKYARQSEALEVSNGELKEKAVKDAGRRIAAAEQQVFEARLNAERTYRENIDALRQMAEQTPATPEAKLQAEHETKLKMLEAYYQASLDYARKNGEDETEITATYNQAKLNLEQEYQRKKKELAEKTSEEINALQGNDISLQFTDIYNNIERLKEAIDNADFGGVLQSIQAIVNSVLSGLSNAFNTFKKIEIDNVEAKYDAEIEAAQGNTEEIERLEQEKAQKKLDIEKKYADVQFAVKASQIIANTALAIMMSFAQLGPIAGAIAAGLMAATGAIQLAAANAERQKVKNMTLSGSSGSGNSSGSRVATGRVSQHASGKYDVIGEEDNRTYHDVPYIGEPPTGIVRSPALISENGAELIVNAADLQRLQRHVNYPLVLQAINDSRRPVTPVNQYATGNYPIGNMNVSGTNTQSLPGSNGLSPDLMNRLANAIIRLDEEGLPPSAVVLSELERKQQLRDRSRKIGSR